MSYQHKIQNNTIGSLQVALANSFVAINIICSKYLLTTIPLIILLELRYLLGCLVFFPILLNLKKNHISFYMTSNTFSLREKYIYFLMAISGGALFNVIYMAGMKNTTAISTGIISSTIPLLIILLSFIFFQEKIRKNHILSACLVSIGICILNTGFSNTDTTNIQHTYIGNLIVFIAMLPEAMFTILAKMLNTKVHPTLSAFYINLINLLVCTPFFLFVLNANGMKNITLFKLFLSFLVGLSGAFFYYFYNTGISKINAQTAGILTGVIPLSTATLSVIFLHESFTSLTFTGMSLVLISIYFGVRTTTKKAIQ